MTAEFIYLVGQVGSFGPCFLVQPELVISCDVTFNLTFIKNNIQKLFFWTLLILYVIKFELTWTVLILYTLTQLTDVKLNDVENIVILLLNPNICKQVEELLNIKSNVGWENVNLFSHYHK